jgi:hypothetical protein
MQPCFTHEFIMQPYPHHPDVLEARLTAFERDTELFAAGNLAARAVALDAIQQVYQLLQLHRRDAQWGRYLKSLTQQAKALETRLRQADADCFHTLRQRIHSGDLSAPMLRQLFDSHTPTDPAVWDKSTAATIRLTRWSKVCYGRSKLPRLASAAISI